MSFRWRRHLMAASVVPILTACADSNRAGSDTAQAGIPDSVAGVTTRGMQGDQHIVHYLGTVNLSEVQAGRLAVSRAARADVRAHARHMVDEHARAMEMLADLASRSGWSMVDSAAWDGSTTAAGPIPDAAPAIVADRDTLAERDPGASLPEAGSRTTSPQRSTPETDALSRLQAQHRTLMQRLHATTGVAFDHTYIGGQVAAHQQVIDMIRQFMTQVENSELRTHLNESQAMIEDHLRRAGELQRRAAPAS
jgi:predicted outer membrane protein